MKPKTKLFGIGMASLMLLTACGGATTTPSASTSNPYKASLSEAATLRPRLTEEEHRAVEEKIQRERWFDTMAFRIEKDEAAAGKVLKEFPKDEQMMIVHLGNQTKEEKLAREQALKQVLVDGGRAASEVELMSVDLGRNGPNDNRAVPMPSKAVGQALANAFQLENAMAKVANPYKLYEERYEKQGPAAKPALAERKMTGHEEAMLKYVMSPATAEASWGPKEWLGAKGIVDATEKRALDPSKDREVVSKLGQEMEATIRAIAGLEGTTVEAKAHEYKEVEVNALRVTFPAANVALPDMGGVRSFFQGRLGTIGGGFKKKLRLPPSL